MRWQTSAAQVLQAVKGSRRLVVSGPVESLGRIVVERIAEVPWTDVTLDMGERRDMPSACLDDPAAAPYMALFSAISAHARRLDINRCPSGPNSYETDESDDHYDTRAFNPFIRTSWPQLRVLATGRVEGRMIRETIDGAPML